VRVPFVLWSPAGLPKLHSDAAFALVDFLPTALAALGVPAPAELDGISQWSEIGRGRPPRPRPIAFHLDRKEGAELAWMESPLKLIERWGNPDELLFDIAGDPREEHPLALPDPRVAEMRRRLYAAHVRASRQALRRVGRNVDAQLRQQLDALGYLAGGSSQRTLASRRLPIQLDPERGLGSQSAPPP
jgi:arylsulfatase A-like enzyme